MNESERLMRLIDGFVATQLLYVAAKLGIADALATGPKSVSELAASTGADPSALHRVLRGLAAEEVFEERDDGSFALGALGEALRPLQGAAIARGEVYYDSRYSDWSKQTYQTGFEINLSPRWRVEPYFALDIDTRPTRTYTDRVGVAVRFYW